MSEAASASIYYAQAEVFRERVKIAVIVRRVSRISLSSMTMFVRMMSFDSEVYTHHDPSCALLSIPPQCFHRVGPRGATCRKEAGREDNSEQQGGRAGIGGRIERTRTVEHGAQGSGGCR